MTKARAKPLSEYYEDLYVNIDDFARHLGISARMSYKIRKGKRVTHTTAHKVVHKLRVESGQVVELAHKPASEKG